MKIGFVTCVQLGLSCIEEIYKIGGQLDLLISLNDNQAINKSGRIYLNDFAKKYEIPLVKSANVNDVKIIEAIKKYDLDWLFIIGWSQIAKKQLLDTPKKGCIGMHPMLLPKGRGRASIPWAILKGLHETGVTMFKLDEGVDTGDIIGQGIIKINDNTNATELYQKVDEMHVQLIDKYWESIVSDNLRLVRQDNESATIWPGRKPEDGEILSSMSMDEADKMVRAVTHPYPGAFYRYGNKTYRIWEAKTDKVNGLINLADGYLIPITFEIEE